MTTPPTPPTDNLAAEGGPRSEMSEQDDVVRRVVWQTLADHQWADWSCSCGGVRKGSGEYEDNHLADVIADALADLLAARDRRVRGEALREAARDAREVAAECEAAYRESYRPYDQGVSDAWDAAADGLRDRADRIEGEG